MRNSVIGIQNVLRYRSMTIFTLSRENGGLRWWIWQLTYTILSSEFDTGWEVELYIFRREYLITWIFQEYSFIMVFHCYSDIADQISQSWVLSTHIEALISHSFRFTHYNNVKLDTAFSTYLHSNQFPLFGNRFDSIIDMLCKKTKKKKKKINWRKLKYEYWPYHKGLSGLPLFLQ